MDDARAQRSRCAAQSILDGARRLCVAVVLILAFVSEFLQRGAHAPDLVVIQVPRGGAHIQTGRVALLAVQLVIVSQALSAMLMMDPFARMPNPRWRSLQLTE